MSITQSIDTDLAQKYFEQIIHGCDSIYCQEINCKGNLEFCKCETIEEASERANKLVKDHENNPHLCKNLSPVLFREDINEKIAKFDKIMEFYLKDENIESDISEEEENNIIECITDADLIPFILTFGDVPFSYTDIKLDDDILYKMYKFVLYHSHIISKYKLEITEVFKYFLTKPKTSRFHIRGLIIMFCFFSIFEDSEFEDVVCSHVRHIQEEIGKVENAFFWEVVYKLPQFLERTITMLKESLETFLVIRNNNVEERTKRKICSIASFFQRAYERTMKNQELYIVNSLSKVFNSEVEAESYYNSSYTIANSPVILKKSFKRKLFFNNIDRLRDDQERMISTLASESQAEANNVIVVDREHITESTLTMIELLEGRYLMQFEVVFQGEEGSDAGGLTREFFHKLTEVAFSPDYGMFNQIDSKFYWFSPLSDVEDKYYNLLGVIVGISVVNSVPMPIRFPLLLYKKLLQKKITLEDIEEVNQGFVTGVKSMRKMIEDGGNVEDVGLFFTATIDKFGTQKDVPIIDGGEYIAVTNENLEDYVNSYVSWLYDKSIKDKFTAFHMGINKVIRQRLLKLFTPNELDILVSGELVFDWEDLKKHTTYEGYDEDDETITLFWDIFMNDFDDEKKRAILKFTTGIDYAPLGGFKEMNFTIESTDETELLPIAHTCMQTLVLPSYETREEMKNSLDIISNNCEGFGFL